MSFFNYKNKRVYYEEIGEGKPILLLHGNTASSNMFLDLIESYTQEYKVILIDFLGHGKSDRLHERTIGKFFHKPLETFQPPILLTGSKEDELLCSTNPNYFQDTYKNMVSKIGHGEIYLFESGHHPAMISNKNEFVELSKRFFEE